MLLIGAAVLLVLAAFAWSYHLERMAVADSAFFCWLMIDEELPICVLGRYGSWTAQLLPVLLVRLGAPLELVLRSYSVSIITFHALVFWLAAIRLKDDRAALVLPMALTAGFHYMFYFGISELYQGMSLTVLLWVLIRQAASLPHGQGCRAAWVAALALNAWISFYHQLLVMPLAFLLVHEWLAAKRQERVRLAWIGLLLLGWYAVRIKLMTTSAYEQSRLPSLADLLRYAAQLPQLASTAYLCAVWSKFPALWLLVASGLATGVWRKEWLRTTWAMVFSAGFLALVLIVDRDGKSPMIYENYYPVLGLVWAIHLSSLPRQSSAVYIRAQPLIAIVVCGLGLLQIHRAHYLFTDRITYLQRITAFWEEEGSRKLLVSTGNFPWAYAMGTWPLAVESALVSAARGPERASTVFVTEDLALQDSARKDPNLFLGPTWAPFWFGLTDLDQRYFQIPSDAGYRLVNTCDTFDFRRLELYAPAPRVRMHPDRIMVMPIDIHNPTSRLMPSCSGDGTPIRLSYRLIKGTFEYPRGEELTGLETDIPPGKTYRQGVVIMRPPEPGTYEVIVDLLVNDQPFGNFTILHLEVDRMAF